MQETSGILVDFMILLVYMSEASKVVVQMKRLIFATNRTLEQNPFLLGPWKKPSQNLKSTSQKASIDIQQKNIFPHMGVSKNGG